MKCQALGIVLCALFSTTYGSGDRVWYFSANISIGSVGTEKCGKAVAFDYENDVSALYNGKTGAAVVIDHKCQTELFIPPNTCEHTWLSSKQTYADFFKNITPPKELLKLGKIDGIFVNSSTITVGMREEISYILSPISSEYSSPCSVLSMFQNDTQVIRKYLKHSLSCFPEMMGNFCSAFRGNLKWLIEVFKGFGALFKYVKGGFGALKGQKVDITIAVKEKTGFHTLIYFLKKLVKVKGTEALWDALNCEQTFFSLVNRLSGDSNKTVDGLVNVIYNILIYIEGKSSDHCIVTKLNDYFKNIEADHANLENEWKSAISCLLETIKELKLCSQLKGLTRNLENLQNNKWTVKNVNMSAIIKILIRVNSNTGINCLAEVLKLLGPAHHQPSFSWKRKLADQ